MRAREMVCVCEREKVCVCKRERTREAGVKVQRENEEE